jgi:hypothetical protein
MLNQGDIARLDYALRGLNGQWPVVLSQYDIARSDEAVGCLNCEDLMLGECDVSGFDKTRRILND